MQTSFSLREALVATVLLSPAFITGLALPWNVMPNGIAARNFITGGVVDTNFHEVRAERDARNADEAPRAEHPVLAATPTGGFGSGGGAGCSAAGPKPTGTGGDGASGKAGKSTKGSKGSDRRARAADDSYPKPTGTSGSGGGCGGAKPTGLPGPTGAPQLPGSGSGSGSTGSK